MAMDVDPAPPRRRLQAYSLEQNIRYMDEYWLAHLEGHDKGRTPADFARFRNIRVNTFRHWIRNEDDIRGAHEECQRRRRMIRYRQLGNGLWPEMEDSTVEWYRGRRDFGLSVSAQDLKDQAHRDFRRWVDNIPGDERAQLEMSRPRRFDFRASPHWLEHFMKRHRISYRSIEDVQGILRKFLKTLLTW
ncbi:uncharacterized protein LOC135489647 [Lineus longissimus]|uniref:uncharacterized protein LOC135489647 n=1 Tax=Lineus longissimus TaxID=88925 RepID=UPI00315CEA79